MSASGIRAILQGFVSYVTEPGEKDDAELLRFCDQIVCCVHEVHFVFDNRSHPEAPSVDYGEKRNTISELFPEYGYYCLSTGKIDGFGESDMVGDAVDDLADLSRDFEEVLWRFEHTSSEDALWYFQFMKGSIGESIYAHSNFTCSVV
jgi:hypothetical protein